jgi:imidazolonepropionase-like amidohydrolase
MDTSVRRLLITGITLVLSACSAASDERPPALAITHVTIVDGSEAGPRTDRTVVVRGHRIVAEGPTWRTRVPRGAHRIDGRGSTLIPGLWDMHVHTVVPAGDSALWLYIANGVTGVRDMASAWDTLSVWRAAIASGRQIGPRIIASGPYLEGADIFIAHIPVATPDDAEAAVDSLLHLGVDFVKIHGQLDRDSYFAIARAARSRGIAFVGHVPRSVGAAEASDSGQHSIEHLLTIPHPCTPEEVTRLAPRAPAQSALGSCATEDLDPLFERFVRNDTWMVPTLVAMLEIATWPRRELPGDAFAAHVPETLRTYVAEIFPMPPDVPPGADDVGLAIFQKRVELVGAMHRAGVHILAGTDAPLRNSVPGFGLHQELALLVRAGLSPLDALRAATLEPARFLGIQDSLGTVEAGKLADLVLLAANPLDDIRHTTQITAVIANGRLFQVAPDPLTLTPLTP